MDTLLNYSPKQTTYPLMDKEVEDAEALIDETFNMIKENENSKRLLNKDIKKYIMDAVKEQVHKNKSTMKQTVRFIMNTNYKII